MLMNTEINVFGGASSYAFFRMVKPEVGFNMKQFLGDGWFITPRFKTAFANRDPNGGKATTFSIYAGKRWAVSRNLSVSLFAGYQHLWYGRLYNNAIGGVF